QRQADPRRAVAKTRHQTIQMLAPPAFAAQQLQALECGTGDRRWLAGGVDVRTGELDQCLDQLLAAGDEGARRAEGLAQGADQHLDIVATEAEVLDDTATGGAQRAEAMGVV